MKIKIDAITGIGVTLIIIGIIGCHSDSSPPMMPAVENTNTNAITDRQKLVQQFHTAEVFGFPYDPYQFVIRATNGAVWYANTSSNFSGITLMFPPQNVSSNSFEPPNWVSPTDARYATMVEAMRLWTDALIRLNEINHNMTNLSAKLTNATIQAEDPDKMSFPARKRIP